MLYCCPDEEYPDSEHITFNNLELDVTVFFMEQVKTLMKCLHVLREPGRFIYPDHPINGRCHLDEGDEISGEFCDIFCLILLKDHVERIISFCLSTFLLSSIL